MPQNRNNTEPPPVMTWGKAMPVIIVAGVFDLVQAFFEFFWFFGPALAAATCTVAVNSMVGATIADITGKLTAMGCTFAAGVVGVAGVEVTTPFGVIMADAIGLLAFLTLGLWIILTNARIVKAVASAPMWFVGAFGAEEVPFLGTLPLFTIIIWRLYGVQIRVEKAAHEKWEKENAAAQLQQRNQQIAQLKRMQAEAANDAAYAEAANDEQYEIPEDEKMAA